MSTGMPMVRAPKFAPKRDRRLLVKDAVPCPDCKAAVNQPCTRMDGTIPAGHLQHPARRRMAVRADNLARGI